MSTDNEPPISDDGPYDWRHWRVLRPTMPNPDEAERVIISVPHSGTRTLYATFEDDELGSQKVNHWHYGFHNKYISEWLRAGNVAHVPIRNPLDVADSWDRRYYSEGSDGSKDAASLIWALEMMLRHIQKYPQIDPIVIELLPVLRGELAKDRRRFDPPRRNDVAKWLWHGNVDGRPVWEFYQGWYDLKDMTPRPEHARPDLRKD